MARKLYGGSLGKEGPILPPNDPRLENLTDEQIELDLLLYLDDHPHLQKTAERFTDSEYEKAMKEDLGEKPKYKNSMAQFDTPTDLVEEPYDE